MSGNENLQVYKISMYFILLGDRIKSSVACMCLVDWLVALKIFLWTSENRSEFNQI